MHGQGGHTSSDTNERLPNPQSPFTPDEVKLTGQDDHLRNLILVALLALPFFLSGCKLEEAMLPSSPSGDSSTTAAGGLGAVSGGETGDFTAPIIADPLPGTTVSSSQPTLTVLNAVQLAGAGRTYLFQVSSDQNFNVLEAQSPEVTEGASGSTSWQVDRALSNGPHYWRVRARSGVTDSPFSSTAQFSIGSGGGSAGGGGGNPPPTTPPPAGTIVSDPLMGGSIGEVSGGQFTTNGWQVLSPGNFIRYEVPPMSRGWVEFDTRGLREINPSNDQFMLFGMWDPTAGDFRANPFRVNIQKLHPNPHNPPYLRVRWISQGEQHDEGVNFFAWNPNQTYRWRLEWEPEGNGHIARLYLDGQVLIRVNYRRAYRPNVHFIELGIGERGESVVGVTYSNLRIGN